MKVPVNCCCDAGKLLGFVEVPDVLKLDEEVQLTPTLKLPLGGLCDDWDNPKYIAIKSNDTPLEVLHTIPSFEEYPYPSGRGAGLANNEARDRAIVEKSSQEALSNAWKNSVQDRPLLKGALALLKRMP